MSFFKVFKITLWLVEIEDSKGALLPLQDYINSVFDHSDKFLSYNQNLC